MTRSLAVLFGLVALGIATLPGRAAAQLHTSHLPDGATALALAEANGGAVRATAEARIGRLLGDWELGLRRHPSLSADGTAVTADFDLWFRGVPVAFRAVYDGGDRLTVSLRNLVFTTVLRNRRRHDLVGDFNELFIATRADARGRITVADLRLDGVPVAAVSSADNDGVAASDVLRIQGADLADGFTLEGTITMSWPGILRPRGAQLDAQLWLARVVAPDSAPPVVTITAPADGATVAATPVTVTGTVADQSPITALTVNGAAAALTGAAFSAEVPLAVGSNPITVEATDAAGNVGRATVTVVLAGDTTPPALTVVSPFEGEEVAASPLDVTGVATDGSGIAAVTVNGVAAALAGGNFAAAVPLADGANTLTVAATDSAGNTAAAVRTVRLVRPPAPLAAPLLDPPASPTRAAAAELSGTAAPGLAVEVSDGIRAVVVTAGADGRFQASFPLAPNAASRLFATVLDAGGRRSAPASVAVIQDGEAPRLALDFPPPGSETVAPAVRVAGRVSDMLSGFLGLAVTVNGQPAELALGVGTNATFEQADVALAPGVNVLTATATDVAGNSASVTLTVTRLSPPGLRLVPVAGDGQRGPAKSRLPQPVVVRVERADGVPVAGKVVTFEVLRSDGRLAAGAGPGALRLQVATDAAGRAAAFWTLGSDAGSGNNRLRASSSGVAGAALFAASADPGPAGQINVGTGNLQRGEAGAAAAEPLRAWVSDGLNGIAGVPVTFTVIRGGGTVDGAATATVATSASGHAEVRLTLGAAGGEDAVEATFPGNPGRPAVFEAFGVVRDPARATSFVTRVLDNAERPIGGAHAVLEVGGVPFEAASDADGRLAFDDIPAGPAHLHVGGHTATLLGGEAIPAGSFPDLGYRPVLVPNAENTLSQPVRLPPLDPANAQLYDGSRDLELTVAGLEGVRMRIRAGSLRLADGRRPSPAEPVAVALNQVHLDDVPMPFSDGAAPPFAWTLMPAGATFDPPVEIELPNMAALTPGALVYFISFNHATERFEIVASGRASADGSRLVTDPGEGLTVAGWGGICPPYPPTGEVENEQLEDVKDKLEQDYEQKMGTAAAGLAHQILCLAQAACAPGANWADGWVGDMLQDIADDRQTNSPADAVCEAIPAWLGEIIDGPAPGPPGLFEYDVNDLCALAGGIYHFRDELHPGFERRLNEALDSGVSKTQVRRDHNGLLSAIPGCFRSVHELSPIPREIAATVVPPVAAALREATLDGICRTGPRSIAAAQAPATAALSSTAQLEAIGDLRVTAPARFLAVGSQVQLTVRDAAGNDLTAAAAGTRYFVAVGDGTVVVSPDGLLAILGTSMPQADLAPQFQVYVRNGDHLGIAQLAVVDRDADRDLIADSWELRIGLDPAVYNGNTTDADGDGLSDIEEAYAGTDPVDGDSDGDGVSDRVEAIQGSNPLDAASRQAVLRARGTVRAGGRVAVSRAAGGYRISNVPAGPNLLRVYAEMFRGGRWLFGASGYLQVRPNQVTVLGQRLPMQFAPVPVTAAITAALDDSLLAAVGATSQLRVAARRSDGQVLDVSSPALGTTFLSSNPEIAAVDERGRVTAVASGVAFLTATNEGAVAVRQVRVALGDPLTTVVGLTAVADGSASPQAVVEIPLQDLRTASGDDGRFHLDGVATVLAESLAVRAWARRINTGGFLLTELEAVPVAGGTTDLGTVVLRPYDRADSDGDGVADGIERLLGTDPAAPDSDADGVPDGAEDADGDLLSDAEELLLGTSPTDVDSDDDGLADRQEDADGDGLTNFEELRAGADGQVTDPLQGDTDGDGMDDAYEIRFGLDPRDAADAPLDPDGDGLSNLEESRLGSDPFDPDTVRPALSQVYPAAGSAGFPLNGRVILRFSEPLLASSVAAGTVRLRHGAEEPAGPVELSSDGLSVTLRPPQDLAADTLYTLTVAGLRDLASNALLPVEQTFATGTASDHTGPFIVRFVPQGSGAPVNTRVSAELSERMDPATLRPESWRVRDNVTFQVIPVAMVQVDPDGRTATWIPQRPLAVGRSHAVLLNGPIEDAAGNRLPAATGFGFVTALAADAQPPRLLAASPAAGAADAPRNAVVVLQFDEAVDPTTAARALAVRADGGAVPGSVALSDGNRRIAFTPEAPLPAGAAVEVEVTAVLRDLAGLALANPGIVTFATGAELDGESPAVQRIEPADGAVGVGTDGVVTVTFSEPVAAPTVTGCTVRLLHRGTATLVEGRVTVEGGGRRAVFVPAARLAPSTAYRVEVTDGIADFAGQPVAPVEAGFVTGQELDRDAPEILAVSPPDNAVDVPVNARFRLRLSEPVRAAGLAEAVRLRAGGAPVAGAVSLAPSGAELAFVPSAELPSGIAVTVEVDGVADLAGNPLAAAAFGLATAAAGGLDTAGPQVVAVAPGDGATGVGTAEPVVLTFDEPLDPLSVGAAALAVEVDGFAAPLAGSSAVAGAVVTFTPAAPLPGGARILVRVAAGEVADFAGNGGAAFASAFETVPGADAVGPRLLLVTPADGAAGIGPDAEVVLTFSESLDPATLDGDHLDLLVDGERLFAEISRSADHATVVLAAPLPPASLVTVVATDGLRDLAGNRLAGFRSSFRTADSFDGMGPAVVAQRPSNGATGVAPGASVVLFLDEPLAPASVAGALFVSADGVLVSASAALAGGGRVVELTPDTPWPPGALAEVFLTADARDLSGNRAVDYQGSFRVVGISATTPPAPLRNHPVTNAVGVARNTVVEVEYNKPLDPASVGPATVTLHRNVSGTPVVTAAVSLVRGGRVVRVVPAAPLAADTPYFVRLGGAIRDLDGRLQGGTFSRAFRTGADLDTTAPAVVSLSPPDAAAGVGINARVRAVFDEAVNPLTVDGQSVLLTDGVTGIVPCTIHFAAGNRDVLILPHAPLLAARAYTLQVAAVEDGAGNPVSVATALFTTGAAPDTRSPVVLRRNPFNGAQQVPVNTVLTLTFDEPVDAASVGPLTLRVEDAASGEAVAGGYGLGDGGRIVTFVPAAPFAAGRSYLLSPVGRGVEDLCGNRLEEGSLFFGTADAPDLEGPRVLAIGPDDGRDDVPINGRAAVRFDEPIDEHAVAGAALRSGTAEVPVKRVLSDGNRLLTLVPLLPLVPGPAHAVTVSGIADLAGNLQPVPAGSSFTAADRADLLRPRVDAVDPEDEARGVDPAAVVTVAFSEPLLVPTLDAGTFRVRVAGSGGGGGVGAQLLDDGTVAGTVAVAADARSATFTPAEPWETGVVFEVEVLGDVADLAGNPLRPFLSVFRVGPDGEPPVIVAVSPPDGSAEAPVNAHVAVRVDEPVDPQTVGSGSILVTDPDGAPVPGEVTLDAARTRLLFAPAAPLVPGATYLVEVAGFADGAGNPVEPLAFTFTTALSAVPDETAPVWLGSDPPDGGSEDIFTDITLELDEVIDPTSVGRDAIQVIVEHGGSSQAVGWGLDASGGTLTLRPDDPFPNGSQVRVVVAPGAVTDLAGNGAAGFTITFEANGTGA